MPIVMQVCFCTLLSTVIVTALFVKFSPAELAAMLQTVAQIVTLVLFGMVAAVSFCIASLVFCVICLRFGDPGRFEDSYGHRQPFWAWNRWG